MNVLSWVRLERIDVSSCCRVRDYENEWKYFPFIIHLFIRDPCNTVNHSVNNNGFSRSLLSKVVQRCLTDFCCSTAFWSSFASFLATFWRSDRSCPHTPKASVITLPNRTSFSFLRYFSRKPHIAGSRRQKETADELATRWQSYGFDKVEMPEYQVLLSFPQKARPNTVTMYQGNTVVHRIGGTEKVRGILSIAAMSHVYCLVRPHPYRI